MSRTGISITDKEATFGLNIIGDKSNNSYMGNFRVKCVLSPLEEIAADRRYRDLLGSNSHLAQERVRQQAFALAELEQRIIECPPFWENEIIGGGHIEDTNVILEVLDIAVEAQEQFMKEKKKELSERQALLTNMIKNKDIEKDPEIESIDENPVDPEEEVEI